MRAGIEGPIADANAAAYLGKLKPATRPLQAKEAAGEYIWVF